jgi:tRNA A-37 threonylcarbamoyl transferase component Bud32
MTEDFEWVEEEEEENLYNLKNLKKSLKNGDIAFIQSIETSPEDLKLLIEDITSECKYMGEDRRRKIGGRILQCAISNKFKNMLGLSLMFVYGDLQFFNEQFTTEILNNIPDDYLNCIIRAAPPLWIENYLKNLSTNEIEAFVTKNRDNQHYLLSTFSEESIQIIFENISTPFLADLTNYEHFWSISKNFSEKSIQIILENIPPQFLTNLTNYEHFWQRLSSKNMEIILQKLPENFFENLTKDQFINVVKFTKGPFGTRALMEENQFVKSLSPERFLLFAKGFGYTDSATFGRLSHLFLEKIHTLSETEREDIIFRVIEDDRSGEYNHEILKNFPDQYKKMELEHLRLTAQRLLQKNLKFSDMKIRLDSFILIGSGVDGTVYKSKMTITTQEGEEFEELIAFKQSNIKGRKISKLERDVIEITNNIKYCNPIYAVDEEVMVMKFENGRTLDSYIKKNIGEFPIGEFPISKAIHLGHELTTALLTLGQNGIQHKDLNSGNIMIKKGQIKIIDFGRSEITQPHLYNTKDVESVAEYISVLLLISDGKKHKGKLQEDLPEALNVLKKNGIVSEDESAKLITAFSSQLSANEEFKTLATFVNLLSYRSKYIQPKSDTSQLPIYEQYPTCPESELYSLIDVDHSDDKTFYERLTKANSAVSQQDDIASFFVTH